MADRTVWPVEDSEIAKTYSTGPPYESQGRVLILRRCFRVFAALLFTTFLGSNIVMYIDCSVQYSKLKPVNPDFQFVSTAVSLLNMTSTSHPELTALQWQVMLLFINPNTKLGLAFKDLEASVIFDGDHLASKRLPDLFVNSRNRSAISFKLGTVRDNDDVVVKKISEGKALSLEVDLSLVYTYETDARAWCVNGFYKQYSWKQVEFEVSSE